MGKNTSESLYPMLEHTVYKLESAPLHRRARTVTCCHCLDRKKSIRPYFVVTKSACVFVQIMCVNVCRLCIFRMYLNIVLVFCTHIEHGSSEAECQRIGGVLDRIYFAAVSKLGQLRSLQYASVHSAV